MPTNGEPAKLKLGSIGLPTPKLHLWVFTPHEGKQRCSWLYRTETGMLKNCVDEFGVDLMNPKKIVIDSTPEMLENLRTTYFNVYTEGLL